MFLQIFCVHLVGEREQPRVIYITSKREPEPEPKRIASDLENLVDIFWIIH